MVLSLKWRKKAYILRESKLIARIAKGAIICELLLVSKGNIQSILMAIFKCNTNQYINISIYQFYQI